MLHKGQIQSGSGLVLDIGNAVTRCGYAGEEIPSCAISTLCSTSLTTSSSRPIAAASSTPRSGIVYTSPLDTDGTGQIRDWEGVRQLVEYCAFERLGLGKDFTSSFKERRNKDNTVEDISMEGIASSLDRSSDRGLGDRNLIEHPILIAEPIFSSKVDKRKWCEMLIETFKAPGVFMTKAGVLSIYANARVTGMSVDIGAGGITVLPVQEGFALLSGAKRSPIGGNVLDGEYLKEANLQVNNSSSSQKKRIRPRVPGLAFINTTVSSFSSASSMNDTFEDLHQSVQEHYSLSLAKDIKEHVCRVLEEAPKQTNAWSLLPSIEYELPDGEILRIGKHRFTIPELLFNPSPILDKYPTAYGLHKFITDSALSCEGDVRRDLLANIVLTGGSSVIPGLQERLQYELGDSILPVGCKARISAASEAERTNGAWIGGSILASLGTFPDLWLSSEEYIRDPRMIERKLI